MEEIGKATLIFTESLEIDQVRAEEEAESLRGKWMEDHERELFWALWLPAFGIESDWRAIPRYMEFAKGIHETRVSTLYFDPEFPKAQEELYARHRRAPHIANNDSPSDGESQEVLGLG